jgi:hypothetical protein
MDSSVAMTGLMSSSTIQRLSVTATVRCRKVIRSNSKSYKDPKDLRPPTFPSPPERKFGSTMPAAAQAPPAFFFADTHLNPALISRQHGPSAIRFVQIAVKFPHTVPTDSDIPVACKGRTRHRVGYSSAKTAPKIREFLLPEALSVLLTKLRLDPARRRPRIDPFRPPFRSLNRVVARNSLWTPIAVAVIKHELRRFSISTNRQARNPANFLTVPKH